MDREHSWSPWLADISFQYVGPEAAYDKGHLQKSLWKIHQLLSFAFEGITSLSVKPLRLITGFGFNHMGSVVPGACTYNVQ